MSIHTAESVGFVRHVGICNSRRIALVLQLPEEPQFVDVIDTDALPDNYHQNVMDVIMSDEAQSSNWLGDVLNRRMFFDGTNALLTLYNKGWIQKVPVASVTLTPKPNMKVSLTEVLAQMKTPMRERMTTLQQPQIAEEPQFADIVRQEQEKLNASFHQTATTVHNQHLSNLRGDAYNEKQQIARNLIVEAELFEAEATKKRKMAEQYLTVQPEPYKVVPIITTPVVEQPSVIRSDMPHETLQPIVPQIETIANQKTIVVDMDKPFVDATTGESYATLGALRTAIAKRSKPQSKK